MKIELVLQKRKFGDVSAVLLGVGAGSCFYIDETHLIYQPLQNSAISLLAFCTKVLGFVSVVG